MMREENSDKNNSLDMYKSYNVDHLGLVSSMFDELGIVDLIDRECPTFIDDNNLNFEDFRMQKDLLDDYKPWYSRFVRKGKKNV